MKKHTMVCDCPPTGNYKGFAAGKFREVEITKDGTCVFCGHIAMIKKISAPFKNINPQDLDTDGLPDYSIFEEPMSLNLQQNEEEVYFEDIN